MSKDTIILPATFDKDKGEWCPSYDLPATVKTNVLKFVTYNTWFGDYYFKERFDAITDILKRTNADIIALQEITEKGLKIILEKDWVKENYFISDISGTTFYSYGVLLLSRIPIKCLDLYPLTSMMGRNVLIAEYNINGQKLLVAISHLESLKHSAKIRSVQLNEIFSVLNTSENSIFMGDFNFCSSWEENSNIDNSYSDVWKVLRRKETGYTEHSDINIMRKQLKREEEKVRFDRILSKSSRPGWKPTKIKRFGMKPISSKYPEVFPSDHFGLFSVFEWCDK